MRNSTISLLLVLYVMFTVDVTAESRDLGPTQITGSVNQGESLWFSKYGCTQCHGPEASKEPFPPAVLVEHGFWSRAEGSMEFLSGISEQEMADLRAYLRSIGE